MVDDATGLSASVRSGFQTQSGRSRSNWRNCTIAGCCSCKSGVPTIRPRDDRSLSLNPKFLLLSSNVLRTLFPEAHTVAPHTLQTSLIELDQEFDRIQAEAQARLSDPNTPIQQLQADQNTIQFVRSAKQRLGVPRPEDRRDATGVPGGDRQC